MRTFFNGFGSEFNDDLGREPVVVTIGSFDGVHLGHQKLLSALSDSSEKFAAKKLVMTFAPHPVEFFQKHKTFWKLFDAVDQEEQLEKHGIDYFVVTQFTKEFAELTAAEFLHDFLFRKFNMKALVVGYDFSFGSDRLGDIEWMKKECSSKNVFVESVAAFSSEQGVISSSRIREFVADGRVEEAESFLGRPFYLKGNVVKGDQRGRELGFPTANIQISPETTPCSGVYATLAEIDGESYPSVSNLGKRPTFAENNGHDIFLETHLFEFKGDLYDKEIRVHFKSFIREEKKFSGASELVEQIRKDAEFARKVFQ